MRRLVLLLGFLTLADTAFAFEMDVSLVSGVKRLGLTTLVDDLAVSDKAHVALNFFCSDEQGQVWLLPNAPTIKPRKRSSVAEVTILPKREIDVVLVPAQGDGDIPNTDNTYAIETVVTKWHVPCSYWKIIAPHLATVPPFRVNLVNGVARLSDLLP